MEIRRLAIYVICCLVASMHYGAIIPLFSFIAHDLRLTSTMTGLVASMTPLGGLIVTLFSERVVRRCGFQRTMLIGIVSQLALLALLIAWPYNVGLWIVVRFLLGVTFSFIFMPPQASIAVEEKHRRAFYVNLLGVVFGLGLSAGPFLTNLKAIDPRLPLLVIAVLYAAILLLALAARNTYPPGNPSVRAFPARLHILRTIWIALLPAILFGFAEMSITAIFPLEALGRRYSESQAALVVSLFFFSALAGQLPLSLLADKIGPRRVAPLLYAGAALAFALPLIHYSYATLLAMSALCGLAIGHGYYFCVAYVNSITDRGAVVRANILIETVFNTFIILVPLLVGWYMNAFGRLSMFLPLFGVSVAALALHALHGRRKRGPPPNL